MPYAKPWVKQEYNTSYKKTSYPKPYQAHRHHKTHHWMWHCLSGIKYLVQPTITQVQSTQPGNLHKTLVHPQTLRADSTNKRSYDIAAHEKKTQNTVNSTKWKDREICSRWMNMRESTKPNKCRRNRRPTWKRIQCNDSKDDPKSWK